MLKNVNNITKIVILCVTNVVLELVNTKLFKAAPHHNLKIFLICTKELKRKKQIITNTVNIIILTKLSTNYGN